MTKNFLLTVQIFAILVIISLGCHTNKPPFANAGNDQSIVLPANSATLNGNASADPDGDIVSYTWRKLSGPPSSTIINAAAVQTDVKDLIEGVYEFELRVTDDDGMSSADKVKITVTAASWGNRPPVANAGPDQTIPTLTANITVTLNGSDSYDSSGLALQYVWKMLAGPANCLLSTPTQKTCDVLITMLGTYSFELKVSNTNGTSLDTTSIIVATSSPCPLTRSEITADLIQLGTLSQSYNAEMIAAGNKLIIPEWWDNNTGESNVINIYDRITHTWSVSQASLARSGVASVAVGNKVFFAGGVDFDEINYDVYDPVSVVDIYDISTNSWSTANLSEARGCCKAVVSGNKIFFAGGLKANNILSDKVDIYDIQTNSWSSTQLPGGARTLGAVVALQNKIYFCGGYKAYENPTGFGYVFTSSSPAIDIYDHITGQWTSANMQTTKGSFAAIGVNDKIYLAGGSINDQIGTMEVEELNVNTLSSSNSCLFQPTIFHSDKNVVLKDNQLLFFSGLKAVENKFDIYNLQTGTWSIGVLPPGFASQYLSVAPIVSVDNEVFVIIANKLYKMNL